MAQYVKQTEGLVFKAIVLSTFVVALSTLANHGYNVLLERFDNLVASNYGVLAESDDPQLRQAGQEVTSSYSSHRQNNQWA